MWKRPDIFGWYHKFNTQVQMTSNKEFISILTEDGKCDIKI